MSDFYRDQSSRLDRNTYEALRVSALDNWAALKTNGDILPHIIDTEVRFERSLLLVTPDEVGIRWLSDNDAANSAQ